MRPILRTILFLAVPLSPALLSLGAIQAQRPALRDLRPVEVLDFDWAPGGVPLPAGTIIGDQWADIGLHIATLNNVPWHPQLGILFDSGNPTGGDFDLATPGYGFHNVTALGNLLIVAENALDWNLDGLVDDPDDEKFGGTFFFGFDRPARISEVTMVDVDFTEHSRMRCYHGASLIQDVFTPGIEDNCVDDVSLAPDDLTQMQLDFSGSGGIASMNVSLCPTIVALDEFTTGLPTRIRTGELLHEQFRPDLGFRVEAFSNTGIHECVVFDTANPTGGDFDLVTPGYHRTNKVPYRKVMVLADNVVDMNGDGLVDEPGDDKYGGSLKIIFDFDVFFESATVVDIDETEAAWFDVYGTRGFLGTFPLHSLGDNSVETVRPAIHGVRRIELNLTGSGALAELLYCRDETVPQ